MHSRISKLPVDFYQREDVLQIARDLLGKFLFTAIDGQVTGGMIVETEAYKGPEDRGSHAYNHRRTPRNEMMYAAGGVAYMYICYGMHQMFNIVTGSKDSSHAILIRAIEPTIGIEMMQQRRSLNKLTQLCKGPGALAQALGLAKIHNGTDITGELIWLEGQGNKITEYQILATARVGMNFEGPYQTIPWRFIVKNNPFVSSRKS